MRYKVILLYFFSILIVQSACSDDKPGLITDQKVTVYSPVNVVKTNPAKVYVHYMPWFETKESSGTNKWGMHWTMKTMDPDVEVSPGRSQIASYYYPLIGPYASGDKDVIEYHLLLMKYAGIDGVIIDWYGTHALNDYASIKSNTEKIAALMDDVGLKFAIDYEDRTLADVVSQGAASTKVDAAIDDMNYLKTAFFSKPAYITINNQPLLLVFGPAQLITETEWTSAFSSLNPKPCFLALWNQSGGAGTNAKGEYAWVYKSSSYLDDFYTNRVPKIGISMGGVYPGFKDFYSEGGWGSSLGWTIDHANGATLDETLAKAKSAGMNYIQLVTWNDFGEGTMIEPTQEFGYTFLTKIQTFTGVTGYSGTFEAIKKQFDFRKKLKTNASAQKSLDQAFYYFVSLQADKATQVLDSLQTKYPWK